MDGSNTPKMTKFQSICHRFKENVATNNAKAGKKQIMKLGLAIIDSMVMAATMIVAFNVPGVLSSLTAEAAEKKSSKARGFNTVMVGL